MNNDGTSNIDDLENLTQDSFIQTIEDHFNGGENPQLEEANFTKNDSKGDQDSSSAEVSHDELNNIDINVVEVIIVRVMIIVI